MERRDDFFLGGEMVGKSGLKVGNILNGLGGRSVDCLDDIKTFSCSTTKIKK